MRHPYGIWNQYLINEGFLQSNYETSLWDLKLCGKQSLCLWSWIMRHPYGIWNTKYDMDNLHRNILWDIPMGFETLKLGHCLTCGIIMRHPYGIWNSYFLVHDIIEDALWDIPMGFETRNKLHIIWYSSYYETSLWDLKLRFLVIKCFVF